MAQPKASPVRLRQGLVLLSLVLAVAAMPATSLAATTTIGPPALSTESLTNDTSAGTYVQYSGMGPAPQYVAPIDGTIVSWRIASGSAEAVVRLRVLRPTVEGKFTGVGTSAVEVTSANPPDTFATSLPVKVGDVIGVDNSSSALIFRAGVLGDFPSLFTPALLDGVPARQAEPRAADAGYELQVNAEIEPTPSNTGGGTTTGGGSAGVSGGGGVTGGSLGSSGGSSGGRPGSPRLAGLKIAPNTLRAAGSGASIVNNGSADIGATVSYADSSAATATFTVLQSRAGVRSGHGLCVKPGPKARAKHCGRPVALGSFEHTDAAGANSFRFSGRIDGRRLKLGRYQIRGVARNASGLASSPAATSFRITK